MIIRTPERGAILVTSLLLLLVLTIIGVSVLQMTRMQERMSGNSRDSNLAFQGAESGLRGAEGQILSFTAAPITCATAPCTTAYRKNVVPLLNAEDTPFWNSWAQNFTDANLGSDLKYQPQFIVEQLAFVPYTKEFGETNGRDFYQVSGRSSGGSGVAEAVVQSTYARTAQ